MLSNSVKEGRIDEIRVSALVFDYPRRSGATDEGMTHRVLTFGLLGFKPRSDYTEGMARPMSTIDWQGLGARTWHTLQGLEEQDLVELGLV
jgi:hypothetical protein